MTDNEIAEKAATQIEEYFWIQEVNGEKVSLRNPEQVQAIILSAITAAKQERGNNLKLIRDWFAKHKPSCQESFYQMDSVNEALPELGIACFKTLEALGLPEADVSETTEPPSDHDTPKQKDGIALIAAERRRQILEEDWTAEHDDTHDRGELANAAAVYAATRGLRLEHQLLAKLWPWAVEWYRPVLNDRIYELQKAGALIAAEIDRLQRKAPSVPSASPASVAPGVPAEGEVSPNKLVVDVEECTVMEQYPHDPSAVIEPLRLRFTKEECCAVVAAHNQSCATLRAEIKRLSTENYMLNRTIDDLNEECEP